MGIAREFSKAGFAAKAIGKLLEAIKPQLATLRNTQYITVYRLKATSPFQVSEGRKGPDGLTLWHTLALRALLDEIDEAATKSPWSGARIILGAVTSTAQHAKIRTPGTDGVPGIGAP